MGRAMMIICAGVLMSMGIISMSTADRGKILTEGNVEYANKITTKNAAHTAIQIAMQKISDDTTWAENHGPNNKWITTVNGVKDTLYVEYVNSDWNTNAYWENDSIRIVSKGAIPSEKKTFESTVTSVYLMAKFSNLVPPFAGALQLPSGYGTFNADGNAHEINGKNASCPEDKPPIAVNNSAAKDGLQSKDLNLDGDIAVDNQLSYQPTDELIARLKNSGNATTLTADFDSTLGSPNDPGVFFIEGDVKLTGKTEGYGILVIQGNATMEMMDNNLSVAGNFTFNGLVIFENAQLFDGHGTPTINGSVLVGDTEGEADINIDIGGDIQINYDCKGEDYAKKSAANAVQQNKYTRVVTYEN